MTSRDSRELAHQIVQWALGKKAEQLVVLDLQGIFDVTDCFVLASGDSELQIQAIADAIVDGALELGEKPAHVEGREPGRWVLIDFIDVVVHVMLPEVRQRYGLERLWGDAPLTRFGDDGSSIEPQAGQQSSGGTAP